jgi:hypothetical protein
MLNTLALSYIARRTFRPGPRWSARAAFIVLGTATLLTATIGAAEAQTAESKDRRWEFLVTGGAVVPTGGQRSAIKRGNLTAAQISYLVTPTVAVGGTLGWARSRDIAAEGDPKLDVFTYDLGAEVRPRWSVGGAITFSPFAGVGAGARSYNYRSLPVDATHNLAAYGSAGGELRIRRARVRIEVRDYLSGFKPLSGEGAGDTRNDVVLMAGLRFVRN